MTKMYLKPVITLPHELSNRPSKVIMPLLDTRKGLMLTVDDHGLFKQLLYGILGKQVDVDILVKHMREG